MGSRVICFSQTTGALGEEVARRVSEQLGYRCVNEEIIMRAAEKEHLDPKVLADEERRKPLITRVLDSLEQMSVLEARAFGPEGTKPADYSKAMIRLLSSPEDRRTLIREAIRETANEGNVIIVAHAASLALAGMEGLLRVHVTASAETRARRISSSGGINERDASRVIRESDGHRRDYFRRFYKISEEKPTHYDLVINTDVLSPEQAAELIVTAAKS
jgi:cytidylate kinase